MKTKYHIRRLGLWWYIMQGQIQVEYFATYGAAVKRKRELQAENKN